MAITQWLVRYQREDFEKTWTQKDVDDILTLYGPPINDANRNTMAWCMKKAAGYSGWVEQEEADAMLARWRRTMTEEQLAEFIAEEKEMVAKELDHDPPLGESGWSDTSFYAGLDVWVYDEWPEAMDNDDDGIALPERSEESEPQD
jgi:hypothetical protein